MHGETERRMEKYRTTSALSIQSREAPTSPLQVGLNRDAPLRCQPPHLRSLSRSLSLSLHESRCRS